MSKVRFWIFPLTPDNRRVTKMTPFQVIQVKMDSGQHKKHELLLIMLKIFVCQKFDLDISSDYGNRKR